MNLIRVFWNEAEKWLTFFAVLTFFLSMACICLIDGMIEIEFSGLFSGQKRNI